MYIYVLESMNEKKWFKGAGYVGITEDVKTRLMRHNGKLSGGAKCTKLKRPWRIYWQSGPMDGLKARRVEAFVNSSRWMVSDDFKHFYRDFNDKWKAETYKQAVLFTLAMAEGQTAESGEKFVLKK